MGLFPYYSVGRCTPSKNGKTHVRGYVDQVFLASYVAWTLDVHTLFPFAQCEVKVRALCMNDYAPINPTNKLCVAEIVHPTK